MEPGSGSTHPVPGGAPSGATGEDPILLQRRLQELRDNQNLGLAFVGGLAGAAVGAVLWGVVTAMVRVQIGWMAVGVGFLTGWGVRRLGRGIDRSFGVLGAALSLLGCVAGNLLAVCILVSQSQKIPLQTILDRMTPGIAADLLSATFSVMDLLFYGLALYEGFQFSIHRPTPADLAVPTA
jgi:hypothetical protein